MQVSQLTQSNGPPANSELYALAIGTVVLVLTPTFLGHYGFFIDEFYYSACANHLALGYVDHPPLAPWLLRITITLLGDSLFAVRLLPALAGGVCVFLTGLVARRLGAGRFGQGLAALSVMTAGTPLAFFGFFSMNAFELVLWGLATLVLVDLAKRNDDRLWLVFGLVAGVGLLNKHTFVLLAFGLAVGMVLTPLRRHFIRKRLWLGVCIAGLIFLPNVYWQWQNGWPSFEFYRNADLHKNEVTHPLTVLMNQILFMNPASVLLWGAGVVFFLLTQRGRPFRCLGWLFVSLLVTTLIAQRSRFDRITGAYPVMFAGGAALWDSMRVRGRLRWMAWILPLSLVLGFLPLAPLALPILSPESLSEYAQRMGIVPRIERGAGKASPLPQWFADRLGWRGFIVDVSAVVEDLSANERAGALILAPSYGHAGAIELWGREYNLPPVCCGQNTYYLWGPGSVDVEVLVSIGYGTETLGELFDEVTEVRRTTCEYCPAWRRDLPIFIARRPKMPWRESWWRFKHFE